MSSLQERVHAAPQPDTWRLDKLHQIFRVRLGKKNTGMAEDNLLSLSYGRIIRKDINTADGLLPKNFEGYQIVEPGNIVLRLTDLQNDKRSLRQGLVTERGIITSAYDAVEVQRDNDPRFWFYSLLALDLAKHYYSLGGGVRQSVKFSNFPNDLVYLPDLSTQRAIADFLDRETARIDLLIEKKQLLVTLLGEKRSAVITSAVTGQYPIGVEGFGGRDSGSVDGSGGVIVHRLRDVSLVLTSNVDKVIDPGEHSVRICNYVDVYKNNFIRNGMPFNAGSANAVEIKKFKLQVDDVVITKDSETRDDIGVPALVTSTADDLICGYHLSILRSNRKKMIGSFLYWHLLSKKTQEDFGNAANGVTRFGLTLGGIKGIPINVSDLPTQRAIADFLDRETARIDQISERTKTSIELLKEYRSALITSAVTGQIDVTTWTRTGTTERQLDATQSEIQA